jgi:mono/diheme cytochrome c family protein
MPQNKNWVFFCVVYAVLCASPAAGGQTVTTVKNGVFSEAQASRGKGVILNHCARCHSIHLLGGENDAPALVGEVFLQKWNGNTLGALYEKMRATMPTDNPASLSKSQYADALAYILQANNFPAGQTPLPSEADALNQIAIEP